MVLGVSQEALSLIASVLPDVEPEVQPVPRQHGEELRVLDALAPFGVERPPVKIPGPAPAVVVLRNPPEDLLFGFQPRLHRLGQPFGHP